MSEEKENKGPAQENPAPAGEGSSPEENQGEEKNAALKAALEKTKDNKGPKANEDKQPPQPGVQKNQEKPSPPAKPPKVEKQPAGRPIPMKTPHGFKTTVKPELVESFEKQGYKRL